MTSVNNFPELLREKVEQFRRHEMEYLNPLYKEARTRIDFIDPLLESLGWDVGNKAGAAERWKSVVVEPNQAHEGQKRSPDYALRVDGENVIFIEAKKPSVRLDADAGPALQARRYGWSGKLPIVVLTDFSELAIYDSSVIPKPGDGPRVARLHYFTYEEFEENWDLIKSLLSFESVSAGNLKVLEASRSSRTGKDKIDKVFLKDLEAARETLASHLAELNPRLTDENLLTVVQLTLDRIVFFRICEDRGIEPFGALREAAESEDVRTALDYLYKLADARYNSGLFHFDEEPGRPAPDLLSTSVKIENDVLADIILRFYPPNSPYAFSVMPIEIMGRAYESFLSKRIVRHRGLVTLELKPEYRKAGGVFYTPEWLSKAVVERTLEPILNGRTPESLVRHKGEYRVLDPSCGSGSFLVAAYNYLLDWYLNSYLTDESKWMKTRPPRLEKNQSGELVLSLIERKRILLEHIFGVDLDPQAVEIAKLSLLVKVLEDQVGAGLDEQFAVFKDRLLPDLDMNIKCGNSLISPDALTDLEIIHSADSRHVDLRPFDWRGEFGRLFRVIVGNPPWLMAGYEIEPLALSYLKSTYASYTGKADLYYLFLERCLDLVAEDGRVSLVVPNKMFTTRAGKGIRKVLSDKSWVEEIIDFQTEQIFEKATNYTQVLILSPPKEPRATVKYTRSLKQFESQQDWLLQSKQLNELRWDTNSPQATALWDHIRSISRPLMEVVSGFGNGVQTGADAVLHVTKLEAEACKIEPEHLKPLLRGKDVRNGFLAAPQKFLIFPYREINGDFVVLNKYQLARAPFLESYVHEYEEVLRKRRWFGKSAQELTGEWWGLMHLDSASSFAGHHLLTPSLSNRSNFALGNGSMFPTGTAGVTSVLLASDIDPSAMLALLNSELISTFIVAHSTPYQGSYFKFSAPYLKEVPIIQMSSAVQARLAALWESRFSGASKEQIRLTDQRINDVVCEIYEVDPTYLDLVATQIRPLKTDWK